MHNSRPLRWLLVAQVFLLSFILFVSGQYTLVSDYNPSNFFENFEFSTGEDPTGGSVLYVDQLTAQEQQLIQTTNNSVIIKIGSSNIQVNNTEVRQSVRLTSNTVFRSGFLLVANIIRMPFGCGTWPAFWTNGQEVWPSQGEIDILEGVNTQTTNAMTLHTESDCSIGAGQYTGTLDSTDCIGFNGCSIHSSDLSSYGAGFNQGGGGTYVAQWDPEFIKIWFFPRGTTPSDLENSNPDPETWPEPQAVFENPTCINSDTIQDQSIIIDMTLCGQWAGAAWAQFSDCLQQSLTCEDFIANPENTFNTSYWEFQDIKVYQSIISTSVITTSSTSSDYAITTSSTAVWSSETSSVDTSYSATWTSSVSSEIISSTSFPWSPALSTVTSFPAPPASVAQYYSPPSPTSIDPTLQLSLTTETIITETTDTIYTYSTIFLKD